MKHLILVVAALALAGCQTTIQGHHEFDRGAPFASYSSFAWITSDPLLRPTPGVASGRNPRISGVMESTLRRAVERELFAKGYRMAANPQSASLVVSFSIGTQDKIQIDSSPAGGYRSGRYGAWGGGMQTTARSYTEGTLAIDFFDVASKQAVWHGWASKRLSSQTDQAKREATINEAVGAILDPFPYSNTAAQ